MNKELNVDIEESLNYIKSNPFFNLQFEHKGEMLTNDQSIKILKYGLRKGYKRTDEFLDNEVDEILKYTWDKIKKNYEQRNIL